MNKTQKITVIASVALGLILVGGALVVVAKRQKTTQIRTANAQRLITRQELAKANGRDGHDCYVAIDGTVYQIKDFSLWQNGQHLTSQGLAYCGADLSKVIDQAPHGRKILDILPKVGTLGP